MFARAAALRSVSMRAFMRVMQALAELDDAAVLEDSFASGSDSRSDLL